VAWRRDTDERQRRERHERRRPQTHEPQERIQMSTVTNQQVQERVIEALASFGPEADQITRESTFEELDIDSLDLVELAQIVEDEYGVVLKGEDMKELKTVGQAIDLITERAK
jgi:acyl carrier protein